MGNHTLRGDKSEKKKKKRIEVTKGNNAVVCEITFNNALRISSEFPCIRMPQRMHSSRLVYVINKISEQNDTALLSIFFLSPRCNNNISSKYFRYYTLGIWCAN